ncbi:YggT family protein [Galbitalea sp. SE-J8]|uniref:YggT family protein n=1 Tax=Galbitalea sp. SE-J8 TaxID=3054952 RepID=UPI00259CAC75|nr:YggT family protein [Galbitalea sp. SE-J8]MDM4764255.1 YggT family protein [Galbitalea sp. SE-J8]
MSPIVSIPATIVYIAITVFIVVMWVRLVLDLVAAFARGWRPRGIGLVLAEATFTVTDPPIKLVRRLVPPVRFGGIALDLAWTIVLLVAILVSSLVAVLIG